MEERSANALASHFNASTLLIKYQMPTQSSTDYEVEALRLSAAGDVNSWPILFHTRPHGFPRDQRREKGVWFTRTSTCQAFFRSVTVRMGSRVAQAAPKPLERLKS